MHHESIRNDHKLQCDYTVNYKIITLQQNKVERSNHYRTKRFPQKLKRDTNAIFRTEERLRECRNKLCVDQKSSF